LEGISPVLKIALGIHPWPLHFALQPVAALWLDKPCGTGSGTPPCSFFSLLYLLDTLAVILGIVFVVVLAIAIHVFRRNRLTTRSDGKISANEEDQP
jgi:hypothetical protein